MTVETGTYISDLVITNPAGTAAKSEMDDHLRLIKSLIKNSFTGITGAMTATHTELNYMVGATTQPAMKDGSNLTTPATGDSSTKIATTAFVAAAAFSSSLPAISGSTTDYFVTNNGTVGSWGYKLKTGVIRWADSTDVTKLVAMNLTALTTGTTRTVVAPDRDCKLGGLSHMVVLTTTQTWQPPAGVTRARRTISDGGYSGGTGTGSPGNGGQGGNASISWITVDPAVTYTATIGAGGVAAGAGTNSSPAAGGASSLSGSGLTTQTSANGDVLVPGGRAPSSGNSGGLNSYFGGASLLACNSNGAGTGYGGGGAGAAAGAAGNNGAAGVIIIEY
jgi:hypothetical protein